MKRVWRVLLVMAVGGLSLAAVVWAGSAAGALRPAAQVPAVVINEVAWGGTAASTADEWIEFYNLGAAPKLFR